MKEFHGSVCLCDLYCFLSANSVTVSSFSIWMAFVKLSMNDSEIVLISGISSLFF